MLAQHAALSTKLVVDTARLHAKVLDCSYRVHAHVTIMRDDSTSTVVTKEIQKYHFRLCSRFVGVMLRDLN